MHKTEQEILDEMLAEAGLDKDADTSFDGDLSQHVWESAQDGGAIYSTDDVKWKCARCERTVEIKAHVEVPQPPPGLTPDELAEWEEQQDIAADGEEEENPNPLKPPPRMETLNEALKREGIDPHCGNEVMRDVMTRMFPFWIGFGTVMYALDRLLSYAC
jgi:hypothetical protein